MNRLFAHQVVEDLKGNCEAFEPKYMRNILRMVGNSQKFYFGEAEILCEVMKASSKPIFKGLLRENITPPYLQSWFEFSMSNSPRLSKAAVYIEHDIEHNALFLQAFEFNRDLGFWVVWPLFVGINLDEEDGYHYFKNHAYKKNRGIPIDDLNTMGMECMRTNIGLANFGLMLLNCKNIITEVVPAPIKLNKKRKKKGKQPIFSYYTLVIKPTGEKRKSIPKHLWNNRIHLARGHFKTYTKEHPLFGKITGRFWWQPHVRGRNYEGIVMKDYEIKKGGLGCN